MENIFSWIYFIVVIEYSYKYSMYWYSCYYVCIHGYEYGWHDVQLYIGMHGYVICMTQCTVVHCYTVGYGGVW